jgi:poly(hydroxyalkanoate) granule-associated protein
VAKAQRGAPKLLDELVAEGAKVHAKARGSARKAVRGAMHEAQVSINESLGDVRERAEDAYENLEKAFQTRVHRALHQLGVPSAEELASLSKRVDSLNANIAKLGRARKAAPRQTRAKPMREAGATQSAMP